MQDLALLDELIERLEGLVDGGFDVGVVLVVEVDAVGAEAAQAALTAVDDPLPEHPWRVGLVLRPGQELRGDDDLVTPGTESGAEKLLGLATAVHLGGVEVGDAGIESGVHDRRRGVAVELHPEVVAPEADDRKRWAVASKLARLHNSSSTSVIGPDPTGSAGTAIRSVALRRG